MSIFKTYTDINGNKVKISEMIEVVYGDNEVKKIGIVAKITNETFISLKN